MDSTSSSDWKVIADMLEDTRDDASGPPEGATPTVLVVEDDSVIRVMLEMTLEEAGFPVIGLADGDAAIRLLNEGRRIGVVITDVRMPGSVDGIGLAGWMREHAPGVPVIVVSAYNIQSNLLEINPAIAIIVRKPYDPREIVGWVSSLLQ